MREMNEINMVIEADRNERKEIEKNIRSILLGVDLYDEIEWSFFHTQMEKRCNHKGKYYDVALTAFDYGILDDIYFATDLNFYFFKDAVECLIDEDIDKYDAIWIVSFFCKEYGMEILKKDINYYCEEHLRYVSSYESNLDILLRDNRNEQTIQKYIILKDVQEGTKIPKEIVYRDIDDEKKMGIDDMNITAIVSSLRFGEGLVKIAGEISSKRLEDNLLLYVMAYNECNRLIGCSFGTRVGKNECNGFVAFEGSVLVIKEEKLCKLLIKPMKERTVLGLG